MMRTMTQVARRGWTRLKLLIAALALSLITISSAQVQVYDYRCEGQCDKPMDDGYIKVFALYQRSYAPHERIPYAKRIVRVCTWGRTKSIPGRNDEATTWSARMFVAGRFAGRVSGTNNLYESKCVDYLYTPTLGTTILIESHGWIESMFPFPRNDSFKMKF